MTTYTLGISRYTCCVFQTLELIRNMFFTFVYSFLCFCCLVGVFGDAGEVKSVSVMEGQSVTLNTNETDIENVHMILWTFGPLKTILAKINKGANETSLYDDVLDGMFRDRLQVDDKTLTITNIRTEDSGPYMMIIKSIRETSYTFNVTIYERKAQAIFPDITLICCVAVGFVMIVTALLIFCICKKHINAPRQQGSSDRNGNHLCRSIIL
ncbi:uncharacterized protein LOC130429569 isoform X2 [Triplophysa dalaica]|uniref:uncharacterized protein LOC130429569 isoform X2 n=1 Tax=Triplophysa dalaica TaxID=1582913 RepID=UPI0024E035A0|nr:uncharacterized protein LOC130429569 isoform X2 [Triplophysa dalaica]